MKLLRRPLEIISIPIGLYAAAVVGYFVYCAIDLGPFGAVVVTDHVLVSGIVRRYKEPVPSDDELMALFRTKHALLQKIVAINAERCVRNFDKNTDRPTSDAEIENLKNKVGVDIVMPRSDLWLPDPYSESAFYRYKDIQVVQQAIMSSRSGAGFPSPAIQELRKFEMTLCKYQPLTFSIGQYPAHAIAKGVIYFPQSPVVKKEKLVGPNIVDWNRPIAMGQLSNSLDPLSDHAFPMKGCFYRAIDPQWYLYVCAN